MCLVDYSRLNSVVMSWKDPNKPINGSETKINIFVLFKDKVSIVF